MATAQAQSVAYPFPAIRRSGLNVAILGLATVIATISGWLGGRYPLHPGVFVIGVVFAVGIFITFKSRLTLGQVTPIQKNAINGALILEGVLMMAIWLLNGNATSRTFWLLILLAVGIHFIPFTIADGPLMGWLAGLTLLNAALGLLLGGVPFIVFGVVDGLLKVIFGGLMFTTRPAPAVIKE